MLVSSRAVAPGDVVVVEAGTTLEVDMVVLEGAVVMSEAVLTGESIPHTKVWIKKNIEILGNILNRSLKFIKEK